MISELQKSLWRYNHGKRRRHGQQTHSSRVFEVLYPENKKTRQELHDITGRSVYMLLSRLRKKDLVIKDSKKRYHLTDLGRWFAISSMLGISFAELCALACACCTQKRYARSGRIGFYMRSTFEGVFKEYYSKRYIMWIFSSLKKKGFASKYVKKTLRVHPKTCEDLMKRYGPYLKGLESWLDNLQEEKPEILSKVFDDLEATEEQTIL